MDELEEAVSETSSPPDEIPPDTTWETKIDGKGQRIAAVKWPATSTSQIKPNNQPCPGPLGNTCGQIGPDTKPNPYGNSAPEIKATEKEKSAWERWGSATTHGVLGLAGFVPGLNVVSSLADAAIYGMEGEGAEAAIALAGVIPGEKWVAAGAKGVKALTKAEKAVKEGEAVAKEAKAAKKAADEAEAAKKAAQKKEEEEAAKKAGQKDEPKQADGTGGGNDRKRPKSLREQYLGRTPGKNSKTGKEVQERMRSEGNLRDGPDGPEFKASDGEWYPLKDADMAHNTDAVKWWNETGRDYGAKSPEVREWMRDSSNYTLDHYSANRSAGAKLPDRYQPPAK